MKKTCNIKKGYTLIELAISIMIVALLASVAVPAIGRFLISAQIAGTKKEMAEVVKAIAGDSRKNIRGYLQDMGTYPSALTDLYTDPGVAFNEMNQTGWNGPYIPSSDKDGNGTADILEDAWTNPYGYSLASKKIWSYGSDKTNNGGNVASDIVLTLE